MFVVRLFNKKPPLVKTESLTFRMEDFREETAQLKEKLLFQNYGFWSYFLIAFCFIILILFW